MQDFGLYCITQSSAHFATKWGFAENSADRKFALYGDVFAQAEAMIRGGAKIIQYRDKEASDAEFLSLACRLRQLTREFGVIFIVNDRVEAAFLAQADGVHLGQDDMSIAEARKIFRTGARNNSDFRSSFANFVTKPCFSEISEFIVGRSTHSLKQALDAEREGASYVAIGPVFATSTKPSFMPIGLEVVKDVVAKVRVPVVAIGGIHEENLEEVLATGVKNVAMISGVVGAGDIEGRVRDFLKSKLLQRHLAETL